MGNCFEGAGKVSAVAGGSASVDNVVSLHPYFKINYGEIPNWKANTKTFYEQTKTEAKMKYYGFAFCVTEGFLEHERAICREGYSDGAGLLAHLDNVGGTFGKALELSSLSVLECHAPASEMALLKANPVLKQCNTQFFTLDGKGIRMQSGPFEKGVSLCPYFKIKPGKLDAWKQNAETFYAKTKTEKGMLSYGFSYIDADLRAYCRETYKDAQGLLDHLNNIGETFGKALQISDLERIDCYAPTSELPALQANKVLMDCKCNFYELDGKGIKKAC